MKPRELGYFKLPLEQRIHKGTESMTLWIHLVEATFKLRGQARQEKLDTWLTGITPEKNWKDREKNEETMNSTVEGNRTRRGYSRS